MVCDTDGNSSCSSDSEGELMIDLTSSDDDDDFEDMSFMFTSSTRYSSAANNKYYEVLSAQQILEYRVNCLKTVSTCLKIPLGTTQMLMNYFQWNELRLLDQFGRDDQEKIFEEAGVVNPFKNNSTTNQLYELIEPYKPDECEICFLTCPRYRMFELKCKHRYCVNCWEEHVRIKIMDDGLSETITCLAPNCKILMDDASVMQLIKIPNVKLRYQVLLTKNFVERNRQLVWCPSSECNNVIRLLDITNKRITCLCGHTFCFECSNTYHEPVPCEFMRKWIMKSKDNSETSNWLTAHTKECPKCHANIEKNGGCNHMICRNDTCRYEFCWSCLEDWDNHTIDDSYYCERKKAKNHSDTLGIAKEESRIALGRYLLYSNPYLDNMNFLNREKTFYVHVQARTNRLWMQFHRNFCDEKFLKKAIDILCLCRETLMYSYIFPYYLQENNELMIFEKILADFQNETDILSWSLKQYLSNEELTESQLVEFQNKIDVKSNYCLMAYTVLTDHVRIGYNKNWWILNY